MSLDACQRVSSKNTHIERQPAANQTEHVSESPMRVIALSDQIRFAIEYVSTMNTFAGKITNEYKERGEDNFRKLVSELKAATQAVADTCNIPADQHEKWSYQLAAGVFVTQRSYSGFLTHISELPEYSSEDIALAIFSPNEDVKNFQSLVASLLEDNPIIGTTTALLLPFLMRVRDASNLEDDQTAKWLRVSDWYIKVIEDIVTANIAVDKLFNTLQLKCDKLPEVEKSAVENFLVQWKNDISMILTESVNLANTAALGQIGLRSDCSSITYWPMYPAPSGSNPSVIRNSVQDLYSADMQRFRQDWLMQDENRTGCVVIPTPIDFRELGWFVDYFSKYLENLSQAVVNQGSRRNPVEVSLSHGFSATIRPEQDSNGQARIGFRCEGGDPKYKKFSLRIDLDRGVPTFDFGSTSYKQALHYALFMKDLSVNENAPSYEELTTPTGSLNKNALKYRVALNSLPLDPDKNLMPGERASLIASTLASAGKFIGTRSATTIVGHHFQEKVSTINGDDFAKICRGLSKILLAA
jgi:hypothetical protein